MSSVNPPSNGSARATPHSSYESPDDETRQRPRHLDQRQSGTMPFHCGTHRFPEDAVGDASANGSPILSSHSSSQHRRNSGTGFLRALWHSERAQVVRDDIHEIAALSPQQDDELTHFIPLHSTLLHSEASCSPMASNLTCVSSNLNAAAGTGVSSATTPQLLVSSIGASFSSTGIALPGYLSATGIDSASPNDVDDAREVQGATAEASSAPVVEFSTALRPSPSLSPDRDPRPASSPPIRFQRRSTNPLDDEDAGEEGEGHNGFASEAAGGSHQLLCAGSDAHSVQCGSRPHHLDGLVDNSSHDTTTGTGDGTQAQTLDFSGGHNSGAHVAQFAPAMASRSPLMNTSLPSENFHSCASLPELGIATTLRGLPVTVARTHDSADPLATDVHGRSVAAGTALATGDASYDSHGVNHGSGGAGAPVNDVGASSAFVVVSASVNGAATGTFTATPSTVSAGSVAEPATSPPSATPAASDGHKEPASLPRAASEMVMSSSARHEGLASSGGGCFRSVAHRNRRYARPVDTNRPISSVALDHSQSLSAIGTPKFPQTPLQNASGGVVPTVPVFPYALGDLPRAQTSASLGDHAYGNNRGGTAHSTTAAAAGAAIGSSARSSTSLMSARSGRYSHRGYGYSGGGGLSCNGVSGIYLSLKEVFPDTPDSLFIPRGRLYVPRDGSKRLGKGAYGEVLQAELYPPGVEAPTRPETPSESFLRSSRMTTPRPGHTSPASVFTAALSGPSAHLPIQVTDSTGAATTTSGFTPGVSPTSHHAITTAVPLHLQPYGDDTTVNFYNGGVYTDDANQLFSSVVMPPPRRNSPTTSMQRVSRMGSLWEADAAATAAEVAHAGHISGCGGGLRASAASALHAAAGEDIPGQEYGEIHTNGIHEDADIVLSSRSPLLNEAVDPTTTYAGSPSRCITVVADSGRHASPSASAITVAPQIEGGASNTTTAAVAALPAEPGSDSTATSSPHSVFLKPRGGSSVEWDSDGGADPLEDSGDYGGSPFAMEGIHGTGARGSLLPPQEYLRMKRPTRAPMQTTAQTLTVVQGSMSAASSYRSHNAGAAGAPLTLVDPATHSVDRSGDREEECDGNDEGEHTMHYQSPTASDTQHCSFPRVGSRSAFPRNPVKSGSWFSSMPTHSRMAAETIRQDTLLGHSCNMQTCASLKAGAGASHGTIPATATAPTAATTAGGATTSPRADLPDDSSALMEPRMEADYASSSATVTVAGASPRPVHRQAAAMSESDLDVIGSSDATFSSNMPSRRHSFRQPRASASRHAADSNMDSMGLVSSALPGNHPAVSDAATCHVAAPLTSPPLPELVRGSASSANADGLSFTGAPLISALHTVGLIAETGVGCRTGSTSPHVGGSPNRSDTFFSHSLAATADDSEGVRTPRDEATFYACPNHCGSLNSGSGALDGGVGNAGDGELPATATTALLRSVADGICGDFMSVGVDTSVAAVTDRLALTNPLAGAEDDSTGSDHDIPEDNVQRDGSAGLGTISRTPEKNVTKLASTDNRIIADAKPSTMSSAPVKVTDLGASGAALMSTIPTGTVRPRTTAATAVTSVPDGLVSPMREFGNTISTEESLANTSNTLGFSWTNRGLPTPAAARRAQLTDFPHANAAEGLTASFAQAPQSGACSHGSHSTRSHHGATVSSMTEAVAAGALPFRSVAVKSFSKSAFSRREFWQAFHNEMVIASQLSHPCLMNIFGVVDEPDRVLLVMDLAENGNVEQYLKKFGRKESQDMAPRFVADLVLALEYLQDGRRHVYQRKTNASEGTATAPGVVAPGETRTLATTTGAGPSGAFLRRRRRRSSAPIQSAPQLSQYEQHSQPQQPWQQQEGPAAPSVTSDTLGNTSDGLPPTPPPASKASVRIPRSSTPSGGFTTITTATDAGTSAVTIPIAVSKPPLSGSPRDAENAMLSSGAEKAGEGMDDVFPLAHGESMATADGTARSVYMELGASGDTGSVHEDEMERFALDMDSDEDENHDDEGDAEDDDVSSNHLPVLTEEEQWQSTVVHRDLKPENMLLTWDFHVKLGDFGNACFLGDEQANRFGGTAAYIAPEVMLSSKAGPYTDLWSLGCVIFELVEGRPAFAGTTQFLISRKIKAFIHGDEDLPFSEDEGVNVGDVEGGCSHNSNGSSISSSTKHYCGHASPEAKDLIRRLLVETPEDRLGAPAQGGFAALKAHPFFHEIDWDSLLETPNLNPTNTDYTKELHEYLGSDEHVVYCSPVEVLRDSPALAKLGIIDPTTVCGGNCPKVLVLTDEPQLFLVDPERDSVSFVVPWSHQLSAHVERSELFSLFAPAMGRLHLRDRNRRADLWGLKIAETVAKIAHAPEEAPTLLPRASTTMLADFNLRDPQLGSSRSGLNLSLAMVDREVGGGAGTLVPHNSLLSRMRLTPRSGRPSGLHTRSCSHHQRQHSISSLSHGSLPLHKRSESVGFAVGTPVGMASALGSVTDCTTRPHTARSAKTPPMPVTMTNTSTGAASTAVTSSSVGDNHHALGTPAVPSSVPTPGHSRTQSTMTVTVASTSNADARLATPTTLVSLSGMRPSELTIGLSSGHSDTVPLLNSVAGAVASLRHDPRSPLESATLPYDTSGISPLGSDLSVMVGEDGARGASSFSTGAGGKGDGVSGGIPPPPRTVSVILGGTSHKALAAAGAMGKHATSVGTTPRTITIAGGSCRSEGLSESSEVGVAPRTDGTTGTAATRALEGIAPVEPLATPLRPRQTNSSSGGGGVTQAGTSLSLSLASSAVGSSPGSGGNGSAPVTPACKPSSGVRHLTPKPTGARQVFQQRTKRHSVQVGKNIEKAEEHPRL